MGSFNPLVSSPLLFLPLRCTVKMRKNNKECTLKKCIKLSGLVNRIRWDFCSNMYHNNCVNITLSESKKIQWFQCLMCVDVNSVNKASIGDDLVLDKYVNTAISNFRLPNSVSKNSYLAEIFWTK